MRYTILHSVWKPLIMWKCVLLLFVGHMLVDIYIYIYVCKDTLAPDKDAVDCS